MVSHVIVDNLQADPWSIVAALAAIVAAGVGVAALVIAKLGFDQAKRQTKLAEDALTAARDELRLAGSQLAETQTATRQTQESLNLGQQQLAQMQKAELERVRALAPYVTAIMRWDAQYSRWIMELYNAGAVARRILLTGIDPGGQPRRVDIPLLDRGERRMVVEFAHAQVRYCQNVRIRAWDIADNKYITEYRGLSDTLAYDIFRGPWLDEEIEERPQRCSDEVSWEVEHFERVPGLEPEPVEEGFDVDAPV